MSRHSRITGFTRLCAGLALALLLRPASATEEIVVHGKRAELEIDRAALRVDLTDYGKRLAEGVKTALAEKRPEARPVRVASTDTKPRG